jgi:MFS family permease
MAEQAPLRSQLPILFGAAIMLSISMGIRQSFGLFMQPVTAGIALTVSDFTLALAVQNLAWGLLQPVAGALVARYRFRPILLTGAALYIAGLATLAAAHGLPGVVLGAGILIGASLACTASAMALAVSARAVPPDIRSLVLGLITGAGSLGALVSAPLAQTITAAHGWRVGVLALLVLALGLIPSAWFASRADRIAVPTAPGSDIGEVSATSALCTALGRGSFLIMTGSYFVCACSSCSSPPTCRPIWQSAAWTRC